MNNKNKGDWKPTDWSNEDKEAIDIAVKSLEELDEGFRFRGYSMTSYEAAKRLKTFKDRHITQFSWKPSEEQMSQLWWAAYKNKDNPHGNMLAQLYEQLKAL